MAHHRIKGKKAWWIAALMALVLAALLGAVGYYLYLKKADVQKEVAPSSAPTVRQETISLALFFASPSSDYLVREDRPVVKKDLLVAQVKEAVKELVKGPQKGNMAVLSDKVRVREVFIDSEGVAFVDFGREITDDFPGGSWTELAAVYGVVNTLTYNFPEIRKVQFLVEGAQVSTLAGHVDIKRPLTPRMGLVQAAQGLSPQ